MILHAQMWAWAVYNLTFGWLVLKLIFMLARRTAAAIVTATRQGE